MHTLYSLEKGRRPENGCGDPVLSRVNCGSNWLYKPISIMISCLSISNKTFFSQTQIKLKNRTDWNVFGELACCVSDHVEESSISDKKENEEGQSDDEKLKESEGESAKEEALNEGECEVSILEETEPLMAERNLPLGKNEKMEQKEENAQLNRSWEKINRTDIRLAWEIRSQTKPSDGRREALIGEQEDSIGVGTDDKHCISVSNFDITLQSRLMLTPCGSSVNVTEGTAISKPQEDSDEDLSIKDLLCFAWQVAQGMVSNEGGEGQEGKDSSPSQNVTLTVYPSYKFSWIISLLSGILLCYTSYSMHRDMVFGVLAYI